MTIAIIDYCKGNLRSVQKGIEAVGGQAIITSDPRQIAQAQALVLPGVGAFADAATTMVQLGQMQVVRDAIARDVPFLGICLGLHLLFDWGEEGGDGHTPGIGAIAGMCGRLSNINEQGQKVKIPHVGWNVVDYQQECPLFEGIPNDSHFYFTHSYQCNPTDPSVVVGTTTHGTRFVSAVQKGNVFGVQFHPEKSSAIGLEMLKNFVAIASHAG